MNVAKLFVYEMTWDYIYDLILDEMVVDNMTVDKMITDKMT